MHQALSNLENLTLHIFECILAGLVKEDRTKIFTTGTVLFYICTSNTISEESMQISASYEYAYTCMKQQLTIFLFQLLTISWRIQSRRFNTHSQVFAKRCHYHSP